MITINSAVITMLPTDSIRIYYQIDMQWLILRNEKLHIGIKSFKALRKTVNTTKETGNNHKTSTILRYLLINFAVSLLLSRPGGLSDPSWTPQCIG